MTNSQRMDWNGQEPLRLETAATATVDSSDHVSIYTTSSRGIRWPASCMAPATRLNGRELRGSLFSDRAACGQPWNRSPQGSSWAGEFVGVVNSGARLMH
jgi:hypothetical protein